MKLLLEFPVFCVPARHEAKIIYFPQPMNHVVLVPIENGDRKINMYSLSAAFITSFATSPLERQLSYSYHNTSEARFHILPQYHTLIFTKLEHSKTAQPQYFIIRYGNGEKILLPIYFLQLISTIPRQ